jgi:hypothetical protein
MAHPMFLLSLPPTFTPSCLHTTSMTVSGSRVQHGSGLGNMSALHRPLPRAATAGATNRRSSGRPGYGNQSSYRRHGGSGGGGVGPALPSFKSAAQRLDESLASLDRYFTTYTPCDPQQRHAQARASCGLHSDASLSLSHTHTHTHAHTHTA